MKLRRAHRLRIIRERAVAVGVAAAEPEAAPKDLLDEIARWRQEATSSSFRRSANPLAAVLGQRGRW